MANPYIAGSPVTSYKFYGRQDLLVDLRSKDRICVFLIGLRRSGKTSVLKQIESLVKKEDHSVAPIYLSLQELDTTKANFSAAFEESLLSQIKHNLKSYPFLKKLDSYQPQGSACFLIKRLIESAQANDYQVLLLLDECERLLEMKDEELAELRSTLVDKPKEGGLRTILTSSRYLKTTLQARCKDWVTSPFTFGMDMFYLAPLKEAEAQSLVCQVQHPAIRMNLENKVDLVKKIIDLCGGQPFLLQYLCFKLYLSENTLAEFDSRLLNTDEFNSCFQSDYCVLSPGEQKILDALARGPAALSILERIVNLPAQETKNGLAGLQDLGLVISRKKKWDIAHVFLKTWLLSSEHRPKDGPDAVIQIYIQNLSLYEQNGINQEKFLQFARLFQNSLAQLPAGTLQTLEQKAQEFENATGQGQKPEPTKLENWKRFLADALPDAWEVARRTFTNPVDGLATAFKLILQRAKEERKQKEKPALS